MAKEEMKEGFKERMSAGDEEGSENCHIMHNTWQRQAMKERNGTLSAGVCKWCGRGEVAPLDLIMLGRKTEGQWPTT